MSPSRFRKRPSAPPTMTACARKRRRPTVVTLDAGTGESSAPWASLPEDMLLLVAWRVLAGDFLDYVRLRAVCSSWRSGTVSPRGRGVSDRRFHPRRWMMLPEGHGLHPGHGKLRGHVRFFNLDTGAFVRVRLPLFSNHCALDSVDGLLLLQRDEDTDVRLLHPFTGDTAELPPLHTLLTQLQDHLNFLPESRKWYFIRAGICASVSCDGAGIITAMLAFLRLSRVAFATSQDKRWTMASWIIPAHVSRLSFHGKIYLVHNPTLLTPEDTQILQINPPPSQPHDDAGGSLPPPTLVATCPVVHLLHHGVYLVECDSEILVVGHTDRSKSHVVVYKLADLMVGRIIPVKSIGGRALFMKASTLSIFSGAFPTAMADTVVYTDPEERHLKHYHLSTGTWSPPVDECSIDGFDHGPCTVIQHIITCCIRSAWNKGLLYSRKEYCKDGWALWKVKRKFRNWA